MVVAQGNKGTREQVLGLLGLICVLALGGWDWAVQEEVAVCRFSGPARLRLAPLPAGTRVEAWVDWEKAAETVVTSQGGDTQFTFTLGERYAGKRVTFRYAGYPHAGVVGQAVCDLGTERVLALNDTIRGGCGGGP